MPKIKVCHNSKEFTVLKAIMNKIKMKKVHSGVTHNEEDSISNNNDGSITMRQSVFPTPTTGNVNNNAGVVNKAGIVTGVGSNQESCNRGIFDASNDSIMNESTMQGSLGGGPPTVGFFRDP